MNKSELVKEVARIAGVTQKAASNVLEALLAEITHQLVLGENVQITGFGTFEVQHRAARTHTLTFDGSPASVPAKDVPRFRAGKGLRESVSR